MISPVVLLVDDDFRKFKNLEQTSFDNHNGHLQVRFCHDFFMEIEEIRKKAGLKAGENLERPYEEIFELAVQCTAKQLNRERDISFVVFDLDLLSDNQLQNCFDFFTLSHVKNILKPITNACSKQIHIVAWTKMLDPFATVSVPGTGQAEYYSQWGELIDYLYKQDIKHIFRPTSREHIAPEEQLLRKLNSIFQQSLKEQNSLERELRNRIERHVDSVPGTVLFADMEGFTGLFEYFHGYEGVIAGIVNEVLRTMCVTICELGGTVHQYTGDAVMASFTCPNSGENEFWNAARTAVFCAIETKKRIQMLREDLNLGIHRYIGGRDVAGKIQENFSMLRINFGISCGRKIVSSVVGCFGRKDAVIMGDVVNRAARLQSLAKCGSILMDFPIGERLPEAKIVKLGLGQNRRLNVPTNQKLAEEEWEDIEHLYLKGQAALKFRKPTDDHPKSSAKSNYEPGKTRMSATCHDMVHCFSALQENSSCSNEKLHLIQCWAKLKRNKIYNYEKVYLIPPFEENLPEMELSDFLPSPRNSQL